jgi:hypothetical protein
MRAIVAQWTDSPRRTIIAKIDGETLYVPDDPANADRRRIAEWEAAGNTIADPPTASLEELKRARRAALAERRWRAETGGAVVDGMSLPTNEKMQAKLTAAIVACVLDDSYSVDWRLSDGSFVAFDRATLVAVAKGVRAHVQACFDREADLAAQIGEAADASALSTIDIESGWPS